jgi:ribosomal-protein-alanine N-acetyltransferase
MTAADLDRVIEIELHLKQAPHWPRMAYVAALNTKNVPRRIALVAEEAKTGAVAGFAVASLRTGSLPLQAELETIAVAAHFQRRGVARQLLSVLAEELRLEQVNAVLLEVRASNDTALALYRSLGFAEAGRRPRYYADPVEDAVLMLLALL